MSLHPLLECLRRNPDCLLQNLDFVNRCGLVIRTSEASYRRSAFLDERMFTADTQGAWFPFETLRQATADLPSRTAHYLFHAGHCGSTLVSRLLAELPGCFPLREPIAFLALAMTRRQLGLPDAPLDEGAWRALFEQVAVLQARCYRATDTALVKATSAAVNLMRDVLARDTQTRVLYLHVSLETYLATMLRAGAGRESVRAYAPAWQLDMRSHGGLLPEADMQDLDDARCATLAWLANRWHAQQADAAFPGRVKWMDFDKFLADPVRGVQDCAGHFGLQTPPTLPEHLGASPLMRQYAKDPSQPFTSSTRHEELAEARHRCAAEIRSGLDWAVQLAERQPVIATLLLPRA